MTPDQLSHAILAAAAAALGDLGGDATRLPATAGVDRPRHPGRGDYASNLALQAAAAVGVRPRELATAIAGRLAPEPAIGEVEVAGPGFDRLASKWAIWPLPSEPYWSPTTAITRPGSADICF